MRTSTDSKQRSALPCGEAESRAPSCRRCWSLRLQVVGFAALGPAHGEPDPTGVGQLYAVNLDPAHWGKGIGRALLREVTTALTAMMFREAVLWVVPENARARALYESEGWSEDGGVQTEDVLGATVTEIRYRRPLAVSR